MIKDQATLWPPRKTAAILLRAPMSFDGSPPNAARSAFLPISIVPIIFSIPIGSADIRVAEVRVSAGEKPNILQKLKITIQMPAG